MMGQLEAKLAQQGWSRTEIRAAQRILERGEAQKTTRVRIFDKLVYWVFLFVVILGNFFLSVVLVPFLLIMSGVTLYVTLAAFGMSFGALMHTLVLAIERRGKHYIIAGIFLPAIALITVYIMADLSNRLAETLLLPLSIHAPTLVSLTYAISFMVPYAFTRVYKSKR